MHGAKSPVGAGSATFKDGTRSKYRHVFSGEAAHHYELAATDPRSIELGEEIGVLEVLLSEELTLARVGESGALWKEMTEAFDSLLKSHRSEDEQSQESAVRRIGEIIEEGVGRHASQEVALDIIERKRKVSETERRRRTDEQTSITEVRAMAFVAAISAVVKEAITDVCSDAVNGRIEVEEIERKLNARIGSGVTRLVRQDVSAGRGGVSHTH